MTTKKYILQDFKSYPKGEYTINYGGGKFFYLNNKLHREDGPAVEGLDGSKSWYLNGKLHREDGPAVEFPNGDKEWWLNNNKIESEEEFLKILKLKALW